MKLLSIDIFQTLVDISPYKQRLWKRFLGDRYSLYIANIGWQSVTKNIFSILQELGYSSSFQRLEDIFATAYMKVFSELDINFSPSKASRALKEIHRQAQFFDDAREFMEKMKKKYIVCLSSDSDNDMLANVKKIFNFDALYTSENLRTYKIWESSNFFRRIMNDFAVRPSDILHIGDASSDVIGSNNAGIKVCWLNRKNKNWSYSGKPDIVVNSLTEIVGQL